MYDIAKKAEQAMHWYYVLHYVEIETSCIFAQTMHYFAPIVQSFASAHAKLQDYRLSK